MMVYLRKQKQRLVKASSLHNQNTKNNLGFPSGSVGKNSPANTGDMGSTLGWEDPMENAMATHSNILAWEISRIEKSGGPQSMGSRKSQT